MGRSASRRGFAWPDARAGPEYKGAMTAEDVAAQQFNETTPDSVVNHSLLGSKRRK